MKRAFPLICRASVWPGMSVLYSDIVLRRMGQVSALAATLRTPDVGPRLGRLVKCIRWDSCVVAAHCSDVIREDLTFIFARCTRLRTFSYHPHTSFPLRLQTPHGDECEGYFNPLWPIMMPSSLPDPPLLQTATFSLRSLDMDVTMDDAILQAVHRILPSLTALESLSLGPWPIYPSPLPEDSELMNLPVASLPSLANLCIFATSEALNQYLCARWEMPQLARLTILVCTGWPGQLLARFGRRLRYLHLFPTESVFTDRQAYSPSLEACSTLSATCPLLEHLVVPKLMRTASYPLLLDSPTLLHLDLWTTFADPACQQRQDGCTAAIYRRLAIRPESVVSSLRTVRLLFSGPPKNPTGPAWVGCRSYGRDPDWPWICHPRLLADGSDADSDVDGVLYFRFPQGWVVQTIAALIPQGLRERWWTYEVWPAVYGQLDELLQDLYARRDSMNVEEVVGEEEGEDDEGVLSGSDARGADKEDSDNSGAASDEDDALMSDGFEARERGEREEREQEERDMVEAATELALPEYPVVQLDRADVLAAFRSSRDRESYNHPDLWDHH